MFRSMADELVSLMYEAEVRGICPDDFGLLLRAAEGIDDLTSRPVVLESSPWRAVVCPEDWVRLMNGEVLGVYRGRAVVIWPQC